MKRLLVAALFAAATLATGCSLVIDPDGVEPPVKEQPKVARGACVDTPTGNKLCGGTISAGAKAQVSAASGGHVLARGIVGAGAALQVSNSQHQIVQGAVSP